MALSEEVEMFNEPQLVHPDASASLDELLQPLPGVGTALNVNVVVAHGLCLPSSGLRGTYSSTEP
jgi:hypothetical protein